MDYHSFVGEITCVRWSIARMRRYLCGKSYTGSVIVILLKKY